jgi:hypothetical protein
LLLVGLFFGPENGGSALFRNTGERSARLHGVTLLYHPREHHKSNITLCAWDEMRIHKDKLISL